MSTRGKAPRGGTQALDTEPYCHGGPDPASQAWSRALEARITATAFRSTRNGFQSLGEEGRGIGRERFKLLILKDFVIAGLDPAIQVLDHVTLDSRIKSANHKKG